MAASTSRPDSRKRSVPLWLAGLIVSSAMILAFALAPLAVAQVGDLNPPDAPGANEPGLNPVGEVLDGIGTPALLITVAVTISVIAAAIAFIGGTKFVNSQNVLENDARRSIYEFIKENPGTHLRATAQSLDLSTTNVLWHMRKLEAAKLVASRKFEGYKVFYPVEGGIQSRKRALGHAVLRNENAQQILEFLLAKPSAHQREIARALGVNHGTIRWHLRKLLDAGLVVQVENGAQNDYFVSELGVNVLGETGSAAAKAHAAGETAAPGAVTPASIAVPVANAEPAAETAQSDAEGGASERAAARKES